MSKQDKHSEENQPISKMKLALGAASLFLFIIGVKRNFKMDPPAGEVEPVRAERRRGGQERRKPTGKQQTA